MKFSLKSLLIFVTLSAMVLGGAGYAYKAYQATIVDEEQAEIDRVFEEMDMDMMVGTYFGQDDSNRQSNK